MNQRQQRQLRRAFEQMAHGYADAARSELHMLELLGDDEASKLDCTRYAEACANRSEHYAALAKHLSHDQGDTSANAA